jgi:predicted PurR-regulated permease PerM
MSTGIARERVATLLFYGTVLLIAYLLYLISQPFFVPLAWAAILAAVFQAPYKQMERLWGKTAAASFSTAVVTVVIIVPVLLVMTAFVQQATVAASRVDLSVHSQGFGRLERLWEAAQAQRFGANLPDLEDVVRQVTTWIAGVVAGQAGAFVRNVVVIVVDLVVTLFAVFFFFRDGDAIMAAVRRAMPFEADQSDRMISQAGELIQASVAAGISVAVVQGALGGIMFALLDIGQGVFWAVVMGFFALLPIGSGIVWAPVGIWLLLSGSVGKGIIVLAVGAGIIGLVDNVLRPALLSGRTQMNGLLVFVSLLGGISAFGFLGLVIGPVIMATAIGMLDVYTKERRAASREAIG